MEDTAVFRDHNRLATCTPGSAEEVSPLQSADLIAYETFRLLHREKDGVLKARKSLKSVFNTNAFQGLYYDKDALGKIEPRLEAAAADGCAPNGFIINLMREWDTGTGELVT